MSIKLSVKPNEEARIKKLGALWEPGEGTWVIPDTVENINPFRNWLPVEEGYIVQRPHFLVRAKRVCVKCGEKTTIVALGAKRYYFLNYAKHDEGVWEKTECPILFCDIEFLQDEILKSLHEYYPFFQYTHSGEFAEDGEESKDFWVNTCIHCHAVQEDVYNFMDGNPPLSPVTSEDMRLLDAIYFKLEFDYFINAGSVYNPLLGKIIQ